jgi:hypothetical protein
MQSIDDDQRRARVRPAGRRASGSRAGTAVLTAVLAVLAALSLSACVKDTPTPAPSPSPLRFYGVAADAPNHSVALRDLFVPAASPAGFPAGSTVPLSMKVWNNTPKPVTLTGVTNSAGLSLVLVSGFGASPVPVGNVPTGGGLSIPVPPDNMVMLTPETGRYLRIRCAPNAVVPGTPLALTFHFDNGIALNTSVPVQVSGSGSAGPTGDGSAAACG